SGWSTANGITVDPVSGEIWIADTNANRIVHLDATGVMRETWGGVILPRGLEFVRGELYVADYGGNKVQVYTGKGMPLRTLGLGQASLPRGLDVDKDGNVWVANSGKNEVLVLRPQGTKLQAFATCATPADVAFDDNIPRVYVLCESGDRWNAYRTDGTLLFGASTAGSTPHNGIDVSPDGKILYVAFAHGASRGIQIYRY
ncbi:MAG: NHL repeat-containing protein, partial [Candidatus Sericytochromatia bacterium]|nr:NHL repeat-containing protein [Candidatus Tanganyikabacteria bacterium]